MSLYVCVCVCVKTLVHYLMVRETQWCLTQKLPDSKSEKSQAQELQTLQALWGL